MIITDKKSMRKEMKQKLNSYKEYFKKASELITKKIIDSPEYKYADTILSYMSLPDEVDINIKMISERKKVFIPKVRKENITLDFFKYSEDSIKTGSYDIREPDETSELFNIKALSDYGNILVLIPGRAFTENGKRLGRGKGYYDRFLQQLKNDKENITFAGVCFYPQIVENIQTDSNDITMDIIYTTK